MDSGVLGTRAVALYHPVLPHPAAPHQPQETPLCSVFQDPFPTATFREECLAFPGIRWDSQPWLLRGSFCHKTQIEARPRALA